MDEPAAFEVSIVHFILFLIAYMVAKFLSTVLDKPFPWDAANVRNLREYIEEDYNYGILDDVMIGHLRTYWFQSKIVKFFMVFSILQVILAAHTVTHKCRWRNVALQLAEYYRITQGVHTPYIIPSLGGWKYMKIVAYMMLLNAAAVFIVYKLIQNYRLQQLEEDTGRGTYYIIGFAIMWEVLTYYFIKYCTYSGVESFMDMLKPKKEIIYL